MARKQAEMDKGKEIAKQQELAAQQPIRDFLAKKLGMTGEVAGKLDITVIDEWASARDDKGMKFICKKVQGEWTLLSAGTKADLPEGAPWGLAVE
ncbi:MAG: hypothetical protein ABIJ09_12205 [Pseudomonadota bacterium]